MYIDQAKLEMAKHELEAKLNYEEEHNLFEAVKFKAEYAASFGEHETEEKVVKDLLKAQQKAAKTLDDDALNALMDEMMESVQDKRAMLRTMERGELP